MTELKQVHGGTEDEVVPRRYGMLTPTFDSATQNDT